MTKKANQRSNRNIHVLVVDDSAIVRQVATAILDNEPGITTSVAADPIVARHIMKFRRPDVILLDLEMPRMDGLTFLTKLMEEDPLPVVICSALTRRGSETALRACELGALDIISKPTVGVRDFLQDSAVMLVDAVRAAARAHVGRRKRIESSTDDERVQDEPALPMTTDKVVAIGASTGGTEAVRKILEAMPPACPGIVVVQHMPEGFTRAFANRVNQTCAIEVKEAEAGDRLWPGRALVAPGNRHTQVRRSGAYYITRIMDGPLVSRHRPSVDVLFHSVAKSAGSNAVGVVLTGMGNDGVEGLLAMKQCGAATIAQDEATCVVFGMPKEAIDRGAADHVVPLHRIAGAILRQANAPTSRPGERYRNREVGQSSQPTKRKRGG